MSHEPILVAGAGVTGLCAAIFLARHGQRVEIWEEAAQPGGLLVPVPFQGVPCDLGSHRVHGDALPILRAAAPTLQWTQRPRNGRLIFCDGPPADRSPPFAAAPDRVPFGTSRHVPYPLRLHGFLHGLGPRVAVRFGWSFLRREASLRKFLRWERERRASSRSDVQSTDDPGFEHFVRERVGDAAYRAFYQPYVEKVWGLPAAAISKTVAKKRVSTAQPLSVLRDALRSSLAGRSASAASYLYPPQGIGALIDALHAEARGLGIVLRCGQRFSFEAARAFSRIVYTGHLRDLLRPQSTFSLDHRGLYLIFLAFPVPSLGSVDTFYVPGRSAWFGRVSLPNNFAPGLAVRDQSLLCVEIPEGTWGPAIDFTQPAYRDELFRQLGRAGIVPKGTPPATAVLQRFIPRVYPLYRRDWLAAWQRAVHDIAQRGHIFPVGRQGLFLHCNIDHCVQMAHDVSQHLLSDRSSQDWAAHSERYLDVRVRD